MALTPEQKKEAHERGMRLKAERERRAAESKPMAAVMGVDYDRFRKIGLSHEEALAVLQKREAATDPSRGTLGGGRSDMQAIDDFRSWLEDYVRREFPRCDGIPDHLQAAHSTGNPDCLPLFGGVRAAWTKVDPDWDPTGAIHPDELVDKSTVQGQTADYDAAFTRSANDYAASQSREVKRGPRGGRYTFDQTRDGRTYRRYF